MTSVSITSTVQSSRLMPQPFRGRGIGRGSTVFGRDNIGSSKSHGAPDRGATQTEARQATLVYAARRREDKGDADFITGTFFIYSIPYFILINIGSTHS